MKKYPYLWEEGGRGMQKYEYVGELARVAYN